VSLDYNGGAYATTTATTNKKMMTWALSKWQKRANLDRHPDGLQLLLWQHTANPYKKDSLVYRL
jgi:hypothetical protein